MWTLLISLLYYKFSLIDSQSVPGVCFCVTSGYCNTTTGTSGSLDGSGAIDIRVQTNGSPPPGPTGTTLSLTTPASSGINLIVNNQFSCLYPGLDRCCLSAGYQGYQCGMRYPTIVGADRPPVGSGQTQYGAYPWIAAIVLGNQTFIGTGALIDHQHVLTTAHKLNASFSTQLFVRLGEWDASADNERIPSRQLPVIRVFIHPLANYGNLKNDIAILRVAFVNLGDTPTITTACLPSNPITSAIRCWIAGWGYNNMNGFYQSKQTEVDVPLVDQFTCQNLLRSTRLGQSFILDNTAFICAGGENGKDACTGDGGAPLVCQIVNQWYVVGLVAWGIGCGTSNVPGVYVNVANYLPWIQQTTRL
ncbi:inactive CLIP domain-containing serine protease A3-like [Chironomus tepperi]|uniref:inactive CLIP domain-containing serine protease A3-like n=1 Tax=Chironomus tepperi TaxID=113505 RepID=UPI00391FC38B